MHNYSNLLQLIEVFALKDLEKVVRGASLMKSDLIKRYSFQCVWREKNTTGQRRRGW